MNRNSLKCAFGSRLMTNFGKCLQMVFGHYYGILQFHGHNSWLECEVALHIVFNVTNSICLAYD